MILGAGIAGIRASLDLAESGYHVYLLDHSSAIGGTMPMLDKTFPTHNCSICALSPKSLDCGCKMTEIGKHPNITVITNANLTSLSGEPGNFTATVTKQTRFINQEKCTNCGACIEVCPVELPNEFNQNLDMRKAIYRNYPQAKPCLDIQEQCADCKKCLNVCQEQAINFNMSDELLEIEIGSIILSSGFELFDPTDLKYYGYGKYPNVLTSLEYERLLSPAGPTGGELIKPSNNKAAQKVAWIQCVGSRNVRINKGYCSSICCMFAIKEAVMTKELTNNQTDTVIFAMDIRTHGKGFETYFQKAEKEHNVRFIRSRIFGIEQIDNIEQNLRIRYASEDGHIYYEDFDIVVLSTGLKPAKEFNKLADKLGIELNNYSFCKVSDFSGVGTSKPGIFTAGTASGPKDIPETLIQASAAACEAAKVLASKQKAIVKPDNFTPAKVVTNEDEPRLGVFICSCGDSIGGTVNIPQVLDYVSKFPGVKITQEINYGCSCTGQFQIINAIKDFNLNRIVVGACNTRKHQHSFYLALQKAGLNKHLLEIVNIREHCSLVHQAYPENATEKAIDLLKMSCAKVTIKKPIQSVKIPMNHTALVIGGGIAGMTNALSLAEMGYKVHLIEKSEKLGGNALRIKKGFWNEDVEYYLNSLVAKLSQNSHITVHYKTEVAAVSGSVGNFTTTLSSGRQIAHGIVTIATGGEEYRPNEYFYGQDARVMTQLELENLMVGSKQQINDARNIVFIQCVGSREPGRNYCSKICCTKSIKMALDIKAQNPVANVFILYRDIRTYGFMEDLYTEARSKGIIFIRYSDNNRPVVERGNANTLKVKVSDHILGEQIEIYSDIICLATAKTAPKSNHHIARIFNLPLDENKFFLEENIKLFPVEFDAEGIFLCGLAHGPKSIEESITQAKAAASRASVILSRDFLESEIIYAEVNPEKCAACLTCVRMCPHGAPQIIDKAAWINPLQCQGCGICAGECPNKAIELQGYKDNMMLAMVKGLFTEVH